MVFLTLHPILFLKEMITLLHMEKEYMIIISKNMIQTNHTKEDLFSVLNLKRRM